MRGAASIKYTPDFKDLIPKKVKYLLNVFVWIIYEMIILYRYTQLNKYIKLTSPFLSLIF